MSLITKPPKTGIVRDSAKAIIYCAENSISGKKYVGRILRTLEIRKKEHLAMNILFENYLTLHFEDGVFKATQHPTKDTAQPFNLPSAIIRSRAYKQLPAKYQQLVLSKVDMSFEHISEWVIC